ncbi:MAG: hypothetical protein IT373_15370 [Polyangiaceae bacterium]|nr:hypothetical protein [Polyangiaceae bacterium]
MSGPAHAGGAGARRQTPRRGAWVALAASCAALLGACPGPAVPHGGAGDHAESYRAALAAEAADSSAASPYLDLLDRAVASPAAPGALAAGAAALDALVYGAGAGEQLLGPTPLVARAEGLALRVAERLRAAWDAADPAAADDPSGGVLVLLRGLLAGALHELALDAGDEAEAARWGERRGCARAASVVGPVDATPLESLEREPLIGAEGPLAPAYPGVPPFAAETRPVVVRADACRLDLSAASALTGSRLAAVDVVVPEAQRITVALTSASAANVFVGGVGAIARPLAAGSRALLRAARVEVPAGTVRIVVALGARGEPEPIELDTWGEDGLPLASRAPEPGEAATVRATRATPLAVAPTGASTEELLLGAAGLLALGEAHAALELLDPEASPAGAARPAGLDLLYVRAIAAAGELPDSVALAESSAALERVLAAWPDGWEARVRHAEVTGRRRGEAQGPPAALGELGASATAAPGAPPADRMVRAFAAATARQARLFDVAEIAYAALAANAPGAPLTTAVDRRIHPRTGPEAVAVACQGTTGRAETDCLEARRAVGDPKGALAELLRLRRLRGAPDALRSEEIDLLVEIGDLPGALAAYDAMGPAERLIGDAPSFAAGRGSLEAARTRFVRDRTSARDGVYLFGPLARRLGLEPDPAPSLEREGRALVLADRSAPVGTATTVLRRVERYTLEADGLLSYLVYDLRRPGGTADVAAAAATYGPAIAGRTAGRMLRRRLHKQDGRVLAPTARQGDGSGADLPQLEAGDYVEQIAEGYALPDDRGHFVLDSPDLLPDRTGVREATIELRVAAGVPLSVWSHPLLGAAEEGKEGGYTTRLWRLRDAPPRSLEAGVSPLEQSVGVSVGTVGWQDVARALSELVRSLEERDPFVTRWAERAAGPERAPSRALVARVVAAAGKAIPTANGDVLSDTSAWYDAGPPRTTARSALELGQGSRTWVVYRALEALGVPVALWVAETQPFASAPGFPAHVGRFRQPLLVARLPEGELWIDADVDGPPLPPGRVSPELRGRLALSPTGALAPVGGQSEEARDEVEVSLALDAAGDARGSFALTLHGRTAQGLAAALEVTVGSERRQLLSRVVLGWLPWADVEEVSLASAEGAWDVALRATVSAHGFARPAGRAGKVWVLPGLEPVHRVFPGAGVDTLGGAYASRAERDSALSLDPAILYHLRRRITLPPGARLGRLPRAVAVEAPHVAATRVVTADGTTLEEDFRLSLSTGTVSPAEYPAFVASVQAIDDGFLAGTRVERP